MTKIEQLREMGQRGNFYVDDNNPGGVATRYKFCDGTKPIDYFAMSLSNFVAIGFNEAKVYAQGRVDGYCAAPESRQLKALETIANAKRSDGAYDKHDMAGAIVIAQRAISKTKGVCNNEKY